jgi:hypothetical protein
MKLRFYWWRPFDALEPSCRSDRVNHEGVSILSCLLSDSGGLRYLDTLPWLEEGLRRIRAVKLGEAESLEWGRETWGAKLGRDHATLHSLHDDDYADTIGLDALESALRAWIDFLQTPLDANASTTVVV